MNHKLNNGSTRSARNTGALLATSLAGLLVACSSNTGGNPQPATANANQPLVKCEGVNECKGTSECKSTKNPNGCQGLNECKGQGWITIPQEECAKKGGKVLTEAPAASADASPNAPGTDAGTKVTSFKCLGINECAGHSECKAADHECKGLNSCKGQGWVTVPAETDCTTKGGTLI